MLDPDSVFKFASEAELEPFQDAINEFGLWAQANGFTHDSYFVYQPSAADVTITASGWWSDLDKTWALIYCAPAEQAVDFTSIYSDSYGVTTGSSKDTMLFPDIPRAYKQAFTDATKDELYTNHILARKIVEERHHLPEPAEKGDLLVKLKSSISRQANYIVSIPFWKLRGFFWYFFRRPLLANKPIA